MAKETTQAAVVEIENEQLEEKQRSLVYQDRRYVGLKETIAYVLFDGSKSFNIDKYNERFIYEVLLIDFKFLGIVTFVNGIWDVINDTFTGVIIDKTRTRWGKFKPYLVALAIPGTLATCSYWLMPVIFQGKGEEDISKFIFYFVLAILRETAGTFRGISQTGMLATITPHPVDRTRLIMIAELLSGVFERLPEYLMTFLIDLINMGKVQIKMKSAYITMGLFTTIVGGTLAFIFFLIGRERVVQSVERPSIKQGIKSIINNKPILIIALSEFLGAFSVGVGMTNYYIDVLGSATISIIVGIPGAFVSTTSFTWVPWFRRRFSTKFLWFLGAHTGDILFGGVFLIGSIGGRVNGLYKKKSVMIPVIMAQETLFMTVWGLRRVIPTELFNESMDYCEWKNGYRTEAMTGVAKGLATKLVGTFGATFKTFLLKSIGYEQGAGYLNQSDKTKYYLFMMSTFLPLVTGFLGMIPKFFYTLSGKKREQMYEELLARREKLQRDMTDGTIPPSGAAPSTPA